MATKAAAPQVMVALTAFVGELGHDLFSIHKGDLFGPDDPAVRKWPDRFGPVVLRHTITEVRVEQATAGPGEKRGE